MLLKKISIAVLLLSAVVITQAQNIQLLNSGTKASIRGLSVVSDKVVWISGSNGTVGKSVDGGDTWFITQVKDFEKSDFRAIEAFDENTAIIMAIAEPAYILRTTDGGLHWQTVYQNNTPGMFLDAMDFSNDKTGMVIGDPIDNKVFIAQTIDGGKKWQEFPLPERAVVDSGEAFFASSGTNIRLLSRRQPIFISGGTRSRLFMGANKTDLPILQGKTSTGANSIAIKNKNIFIIVGGDFNSKDDTTQNCCITNDGGKTFIPPAIRPHGYRSCVEYLQQTTWISCGLSGVDISKDDGQRWRWISKEGFHVCRKAKKGKAVFFAGGGGRIGKLIE